MTEITVIADGQLMTVRPTESPTMFNTDIQRPDSIYTVTLPASVNVRWGPVSSNHIVLGKDGIGSSWGFQATSSEGYSDGTYWTDKYPQVNQRIAAGEGKIISFGWGRAVVYVTPGGTSAIMSLGPYSVETLAAMGQVSTEASPISPYMQMSVSSNLVGTGTEYPTAPVYVGTNISAISLMTEVAPVPMEEIPTAPAVTSIAPAAAPTAPADTSITILSAPAISAPATPAATGPTRNNKLLGLGLLAAGGYYLLRRA